MSNDFYLFANCNFVPDRYGDWQVAYDELAQYVESSELTTKSYYFGIPMDYAHDFSKTTSMFAFEVYGSRDDLYKTHLSSPAMSKFLSQIPAASTTGLDLNHYRLIAGFLDSSHSRAECEIMQDVRIVCIENSARTAVLSSLYKLITGVETSEQVNGGKGGVLTYMGFASLDDDLGVRLFGRWRTRGEFESFIRRGDVGRFWEENKGNVRSMEQRGYVPNG
ncbi:uncharacterized protein BDR25DRAFT_375052 [Lindgomyces ingoldianus]|uniref:Uncharacterized protein n=1 Tax=Lindgomyces ingoldianus TaxID=673940 RepID=A0ACB6RA90_9PLEO|nr:uncharacterized protein BDR25DRAFT_375052 [Lindgomyces ingoldianus]KAF2476238.1 hypothetical protein BDR25DRAFT_375052 [Lindgomyces ingoldianus]